VSVKVRAEKLKIGDRVELRQPTGLTVLCLLFIEHRVNGIKFTAIKRDGSKVSFGLKYGQLTTRLDG
jgi:hypothetical protein